nr:hypothetical protein [Fibrella rubiginis]
MRANDHIAGLLLLTDTSQGLNRITWQQYGLTFDITRFVLYFQQSFFSTFKHRLSDFLRGVRALTDYACVVHNAE